MSKGLAMAMGRASVVVVAVRRGSSVESRMVAGLWR